MKTTTTKLLFLLATGPLVLRSVHAGTLDPPAPPAPTMVTVQQIYDKLGAPGAVAKTGQTGCWNAAGNPVNCTGTGQDAEFQKGVSVFPRFTDNADGTVKDNLTGLIWLKNAHCFAAAIWTNALGNSNALASGACGLTDGSIAGDWRLPNINELESLIDFGHYNPALPGGHPFTGVVLGSTYWSSTTSSGGGSGALRIGSSSGLPEGANKTASTSNVWPVRGGQ